MTATITTNIVGARKSTLPQPYVRSVTRWCESCKAEIWLASSLARELHRYRHRILCAQCAARRASIADE